MQPKNLSLVTNLRGKCGMCGRCCQAIHLPLSPKDIQEMHEKGNNPDASFIHQNWTPISKEEAFDINPYFLVNEKRIKEEELDLNYEDLYFYTCNRLDKESKLCTVHDLRPNVCSGYPWYGGRPHVTELFYSEDCGYRIDVEDEKRRLEESE
ncbi:Flagellin N-methylase [compost metagenome]